MKVSPSGTGQRGHACATVPAQRGGAPSVPADPTLAKAAAREKGHECEGLRRFHAVGPFPSAGGWGGEGGGGWHKASVSDCLPLAAPIGLSPLLILTLCGPERVLVVSTEPPDDLSCLTTPGVGRPGDGLLPVPLTR